MIMTKDTYKRNFIFKLKSIGVQMVCGNLKASPLNSFGYGNLEMATTPSLR